MGFSNSLTAASAPSSQHSVGGARLASGNRENTDMDMEIDVEQGPKRSADLTKIEPATFRGVDCAVLAERYAAYRRTRSSLRLRRTVKTSDHLIFLPIASVFARA